MKGEVPTAVVGSGSADAASARAGEGDRTSRVLVAYATRNGSTQQVAEAVARVVSAAGAAVEVAPAASVTGPLAGWDLVILGAAIYSGRWHREARRFLGRHRRELAGTPVAVFALGPRSDDADAWRRS